MTLTAEAPAVAAAPNSTAATAAPNPTATEPIELAATYDIAAEQIVLGAMLIAAHAIDSVIDILDPGDFYRPNHTTICQAIFNAYGAGRPTDYAAIAHDLLTTGDLSRIGGIAYLSECAGTVPIAANGAHFAAIVAECAGRRRLAVAGVSISQTATNPGLTLAEAQDRAGQQMLDATMGRDDDNTSRMGDLFDEALQGIEAAGKRRGLRGISTGIVDLDKLTGGFQAGQLIVVAGRPGMGKSTAALDFLRITAIRDGRPALYFSLEMAKLELINRTLSAETGIPYHAIRDGLLSDSEWGRLGRKMAEISQQPMFVDDGNLNLAQMRARGRRIKQRHGLSIAAVDYIQLAPSVPGGKDRNREQEVSQLTRGLKLLAKELECPIIAVSQLNRGPESRQDKRPTLSDLRESGAIEQDADIVILLHREDYYDKECARAGEADFIVAKHRGGATETITVASQLHISRFSDFHPDAI